MPLTGHHAEISNAWNAGQTIQMHSKQLRPPCSASAEPNAHRRCHGRHHLRSIEPPGHCTNRKISTQKATERRCAMKPWLQHTALSAVVLAFLPLIELASPAVSHAQPPPPCPPGMYWNFATVVCEFPPPPPVYIDPWLPVYVPDIVDADLDLDVDIPIPGPPGIGAPGRPGGIGPGGPNIGRPGPAPRPRGGGGGRRGGGRR